jgi:hypothetical protein
MFLRQAMTRAHRAQRGVIRQPGECHELRDIDLLGPTGFWIGDIGEPFQLGRHVGQRVVLGKS